MMRLGTILALSSALMATRTAAQRQSPSNPQALTAAHDSGAVPSAGGLQSSGTTITFPDSSSLRFLTSPLSQADSTPRHKSPFLAWFLSWLVPGGGQGYNGQWGKAALFFVPAAVGVALIASNDGFLCTGDCGTRDAGLVLAVVSSVASQIEAPIAAGNINRKAREAAPSRVTLTVATISF